MKSQQDESRVGLLEIVCALAALTAVVGSVVWRLNFNLIIALFMLVAVYAVLRDFRILWQVKKGNEQSNAVDVNAQISRRFPDVRPQPHASAIGEQKVVAKGLHNH